jgi:hypothetical protein
MVQTVDEKIAAAARRTGHTAADGNGAWIASTHEARLFACNQAVVALSLAERLAQGWAKTTRASSAGAGTWARWPAVLDGLIWAAGMVVLGDHR